MISHAFVEQIKEKNNILLYMVSDHCIYCVNPRDCSEFNEEVDGHDVMIEGTPRFGRNSEKNLIVHYIQCNCKQDE